MQVLARVGIAALFVAQFVGELTEAACKELRRVEITIRLKEPAGQRVNPSEES